MQGKVSPEEEFWRSGRFFRLLVESAEEYAIFSMDHDGIITMWNPGAERLLGWSTEEAVGRSGAITFTEEDRGAGIPEKEMNRAATKGRAEDTRWHVRKGGEHFWANGIITAVENDAGEHVGFAKILRDLTPQKQHEEALKQSNERLQAFASYVAHEVRSPLVGFRLHLSLLFRKHTDVLDAETLELARDAQEALKDLDQFVSDLLSYARLDELSEVTREPTESEKALRDALGDLRSLIRQRGAEVTFGDLPRIYANPTQLRHLFRNLVSNAIKHNDAETPRVDVDAEQGEDTWLFRVRDNGVGISEENQEEVFELFQRGAASARSGMGVGLVLSKRIVEQNGGSIWFESTPGSGTTFFFTLRKSRNPTEGEGE